MREEFRKSSLSNVALSKKFKISLKTVSKWRHRSILTDKSSRPNLISYSLSDLDMIIATKLRYLTWWALDEITEILNPTEPNKIRSAVYRTFVREGVSTVPAKEKEKSKKFKEYDPGYIHVDVTYLPKINGIKYYLFVAIDRATRALFYKIYDAKTAENAASFLNESIDFFPYKITHTLTDNGLEFTNRLLKSKGGKYCTKKSKFGIVCANNKIDHRCTKPYTPKTNGMVEKANDIIKSKTIKISKYKTYQEMDDDLMSFLKYYNLHRRHGSLRRELNVKTPIQAVEKWYDLDPEIFKINPVEFRIKIINLA